MQLNKNFCIISIIKSSIVDEKGEVYEKGFGDASARFMLCIFC
jgi:hypothetical protein